MRRRHAERLELKGFFFSPFHELESQLSHARKPGNPRGVDRAFVIRTAPGGKHPPRVLVGGPLVGHVGERGARLRSERQLDPVPGDLPGFGRRHDQVFGWRRWRGWRRRRFRCGRRGDGASVRAPAAADVERDQPDENPWRLAREVTEHGTRFTRPVTWAAGRTGPWVTVRCGHFDHRTTSVDCGQKREECHTAPEEITSETVCHIEPGNHTATSKPVVTCA